MKLMVCGSRTITDSVWIKAQIEKLIEENNFNISDISLIFGGAKGVDSVAGKWAEEKNLQVELFKPDWARYGRGAGIVRNKLMVEACDFCLILWDGVSKGTKSDIDLCIKLGKKFKTVIA